MRRLRLPHVPMLLPLFAVSWMAAQAPPSPPPPTPAGQAPAAAPGDVDEQPGVEFRTTVDFVVTPVTVTDSDGNFVNGLQPQQFHLFDNDKPQDIKVDVAFHPISVVVAVQANSSMEAVLPKVQKIGVLMRPLVYGEQGEAAVLAFDHRLQVLQDFTSDADKVAEAVKRIKVGSSSSRLIDAAYEGVRMLRRQPPSRRRVLLLISETRDIASEGRARETLHAAQLANVSIYTVDVSRLFTTLTAKAQPPRPDPLPPAARPLPPNVPATPNTVMQTFGSGGNSANFVPLFVEIFRDVKAIFKSNPAEVFTKGTGGREFGFTTQRALEEAVTSVGREIHSQYLVSYSPNNREESGFHRIRVEVSPGGRDLRIRTRPGYWLGALPK